MKNLITIFATVIVTLSITGCCTICPSFCADSYNQEIYDQLNTCKNDSLLLMDKSVTSYSQNLVEIDDLRNKLSRLESLLQKRRANDFSRKQYSLLMARDKGLLGDFLATWKEDDKFNQAYIDGSKKNISAAFDEMISTESARKK